MKRSTPWLITMIVLAIVFISAILFFWHKKVSAASATSIDPEKKEHAEMTCKKRLGRRAEGERLEECIHQELIRNAETIDEALAIEQLYRGRPLTEEEKLAVTAETMFDEYDLR